MVKRLLAACSFFLLILPVVVSCAGANVSAATLVPVSANTVVQVQVGEIISNPALKKVYDELAKTKSSWPQTADQALDQLQQKTGLDLSTVTTAVFFADIESADKTQMAYAALIASGSFDESIITARMAKDAPQGLASSAYKGFKVYSDAQGKSEIAFIAKDRIVMGTPKAVRDTIDVIKGDQKPISGSIMAAFNRVGRAQVTGAFVPPEKLRSQMGKSVPQQPQLSLKTFQDIDAIAFAVDLQLVNLSGRIDAHFANAGSAQDAKDTITGAISIAKGTTQDANIKTALSSVQVSTSDSWVSVRGVTSLAALSTVGGGMPTPK